MEDSCYFTVSLAVTVRIRLDFDATYFINRVS